MTRFYVTMTWDNFPKGGIYGIIVEADSPAQAEELCKQEMAKFRAETLFNGDWEEPPACVECGNTEHDGSDVCPDCGCIEWTEGVTHAQSMLSTYGDDWHVIDCFDLDAFITRHLLGTGAALAMDEAAEAFDGVQPRIQQEDCAYKRAVFREGWKAASVPLTLALSQAEGAINSLMDQIEQMQGMFDDEDGTIKAAQKDGEAALEMIEAIKAPKIKDS